MTVQDYVLQQLKEYADKKQNIKVLEFEVHTLIQLSHEENDA